MNPLINPNKNIDVLRIYVATKIIFAMCIVVVFYFTGCSEKEEITNLPSEKEHLKSSAYTYGDISKSSSSDLHTNPQVTFLNDPFSENLIDEAFKGLKTRIYIEDNLFKISPATISLSPELRFFEENIQLAIKLANNRLISENLKPNLTWNTNVRILSASQADLSFNKDTTNILPGISYTIIDEWGFGLYMKFEIVFSHEAYTWLTLFPAYASPFITHALNSVSFGLGFVVGAAMLFPSSHYNLYGGDGGACMKIYKIGGVFFPTPPRYNCEHTSY